MTAPAGWYPDPAQPGTTRYWDGGRWTERRSAPEGPWPGGAQPGGPDPAYGTAEGMSYPGSVSPVPTGEHVVSGGWGRVIAEAEVAESGETTGSYPVQVPDGGYDGYAAVGAGAYRSGGTDPYAGYVAPDRPEDGGDGTGVRYGRTVPGVGGLQGNFGHAAGGPPGYGHGGAPGAGAPGPRGGPGSGPPDRGGRRGAITAAVIIAAVLLVAVAVLLVQHLTGDGSTAPASTDPVPTGSAPGTTPPADPDPSTAPPVQGGQGSAGGDGVTDGRAYVVDLGGTDLGASLDGAFPADGEYAAILRVTERTPVLVTAGSPEDRSLEITLSGNGVDAESRIGDLGWGFDVGVEMGWSGNPVLAAVLDPGDYELVLSDGGGDPTAFELVVLSGDDTVLEPGESLPLTLEAEEARLYAVTVEAGEELTVTLQGSDLSDPYLVIVHPDGWLDHNDDWGSSSYDGGSLPYWLDSGLTVSGAAGEYIVVVTTYAGAGGTLVAEAEVE